MLYEVGGGGVMFLQCLQCINQGFYRSLKITHNSGLYILYKLFLHFKKKITSCPPSPLSPFLFRIYVVIIFPPDLKDCLYHIKCFLDFITSSGT